MLDQLRPMAIFAKTIELGSFRAAANALKLSPSVVSHHISQLETQLGTALIYRSTRQLSLTREGTLLYNAAREMNAAAEDALDAVAARTGQPIGELRLTVPAAFTRSCLVYDLAAFCNAYPKITMNLTFSDQWMDITTSGVDVALRMAVGPLPDSALKVRRLFDIRRFLVGAPRYIDNKPPILHPSQLEEWDWLTLPDDQHSAQFSHRSQAAASVSVRSRIVCDSDVMLYRLAKSGLGINTGLDYIVNDDLATGALQRILPDWHQDPAVVYLVMPPNVSRVSVTGYFLEFLDDRLRLRRAEEAKLAGADSLNEKKSFRLTADPSWIDPS